MSNFQTTSSDALDSDIIDPIEIPEEEFGGASGNSFGEASEEFFYRFLRRIKQIVDFEAATLYWLDENSGKLKIVAHNGMSIDFINAMNFSMGSGLSAWAAEKKRIIHLPDIHKGARHGHNPIRSFLSLPLILDEKVIGVLNLAHVLPNAFGTEQLKHLESMIKKIVQGFRESMDYDDRKKEDS